jgi:hypothetical protein
MKNVRLFFEHSLSLKVLINLIYTSMYLSQAASRPRYNVADYIVELERRSSTVPNRDLWQVSLTGFTNGLPGQPRLAWQPVGKRWSSSSDIGSNP